MKEDFLRWFGAFLTESTKTSWKQNRIDGMNDTVRCDDISDDHCGIVHHEIIAIDRHQNSATCQRFDFDGWIEGDDGSSGEVACNNVISKNLDEQWLVLGLEQIGDGSWW